MKENLIIFNARIVTPQGFTARRGSEMSDLHIVERGTVEITEGLITYVGAPREDERAGFRDGYLYYDARGRCLLPGFVDSHTHFVFGGERSGEFARRLAGESYMQIKESGGGITSSVKATREASFDQLRDNAARLLAKMTEMGITTVEGKSGYGLDRETELTQLRVMRSLSEDDNCTVDIVSTFLGAHAIPPEYEGRADDYIDFIIDEMLPVVSAEMLAECCDVFCENGFFSVEQSRRLLLAAKEYGFAPKLHADEIVSTGGSELAAEVSALSADHLLHASDKGIWAMAEAEVVTTLLPLTAFALKEPFAPARKMIEAGCAVALATDLNPGSCFSGSVPLTIALACIHMGMSVEEVITALTLNGAAAVGRAESIGSIEPGKKGDLILLSTGNYHILPYYVGMNCVEVTVKDGRICYELIYPRRK